MRSVLRTFGRARGGRSRSSRVATRDAHRDAIPSGGTSIVESASTVQADRRSHRFAARRHADQRRRLGARHRSACTTPRRSSSDASPALRKRAASISARSASRRATSRSRFRRTGAFRPVFATPTSAATSSRSTPPTRRSIVCASSSSPPTRRRGGHRVAASSTWWPVPRSTSCRRSTATAFRPASA